MRPAAPELAPPPGGGLRSRSVLALVWLGLGCGLAPFLWALGFCFPRGDDFDEVTRAMFLFDVPGGLYEVGREWLTWSGRYTYHFLAVFLGKAGSMRLAAGLVCGTVLALHGAAFYGLARAAAVGRRDGLPLATLAVLALCASTGHLPGFYLFTEALTTGLQPAAALLFFWSLCALWNSCKEGAPRRAGRRAALIGVLAAGVFEHAALAVLAGACIACGLAWFHERRHGRGAGRLRAFLIVTAWCLGGTLFSFLAPGNFARRAARGIDAETVARQLAALPADWLDALTGFVHSPWPLTALGLAFLVALLQKRDRPGLARGEALLLAALAPGAFCLFGVAVAGLHALSDMPLHASAKLPASLGLYAACALGFTVFGLLRALPGLPRQRRGAALALGAALLALCCASANFQRTLENAVNGGMALYAGAMERRDAWLRHEGARSPWGGKWRFGLAGEALYPGSRSRGTRPGAPVLPVARWTRQVFPVWTFGDLRAKAAQWPNPWAAWMYGVAAVATARPDPAALAALGGAGGEGARMLGLPEEARRLGLTGAWRVNTPATPNPTFALDWLVLESEKALPQTLAVLVPSPLSRARMAPLFVQAWLLRALAGDARAGAPALWAGPELAFEPGAWRVKGTPASVFRYAFPLGPAAPLARGESVPLPGEWPPGIFLHPAGAGYLRLAPAVLDSGRESG